MLTLTKRAVTLNGGSTAYPIYTDDTGAEYVRVTRPAGPARSQDLTVNLKLDDLRLIGTSTFELPTPAVKPHPDHLVLTVVFTPDQEDSTAAEIQLADHLDGSEGSRAQRQLRDPIEPPIYAGKGRAWNIDGTAWQLSAFNEVPRG